MSLTTEARGHGEIKFVRLKTFGLFIAFFQLLMLLARFILAGMDQQMYLKNAGIHSWILLLSLIPASFVFLVDPKKLLPYVVWFLLLSCLLIRRSDHCMECEDGFWLMTEATFPFGLFLSRVFQLHDQAAHIFITCYAFTQSFLLFLLSRSLIFRKQKTT